MSNQTESKVSTSISGWVTLLGCWAIILCSGYEIFTHVLTFMRAKEGADADVISGVLFVLFGVVLPLIIMSGNVTLQKNQARVFTFMGDYKGTLKGPIYAAVPFWWTSQGEHNLSTQTIEIAPITVNDKSGNPIIIACNIFAHIEDTYAATFSITDLPAYLKLKGEVALRSIAKNYPMDSHDEAVISLRGSSAEIAEELAKEISISYQAAGYVLETNPVGITSLTYAPEIAQVMLQRQQAKATVEARETITEGAVQIVKNTLDMLEKERVVVFDQASKQQLVTGLMITLVSQHGASPVLTVK